MSTHLFVVYMFALSTAPADAQPVDKVEQVARIEAECGLKAGTIRVVDDRAQLRPSPSEDYEKIDCALERLSDKKLVKLGFVGNEADPNAILPVRLQYIAEGSSSEIAAVTKAAKADGWLVTLTAASNGISIVQFESSTTMTHGQAGKLIDRIWNMEFGDIAFGFAPQKLSDPNNSAD